ncbi:hypothetical protein BKH43_04130 [Helicobacter sp. 13S00401-1]|uniref:energy transducer TonB n=1 Tax=Helicobacter sp. 13S00401-1 TaxID=1905758 RepID=UPI000BA76B91|nr:energy transducer TonB [Helicobacter sp. 13S00401-1]PAF50752.1 hypothetical protein BKH43_04130 [Helicobacter sp. 13S00401-1]
MKSTLKARLLDYAGYIVALVLSIIIFLVMVLHFSTAKEIKADSPNTITINLAQLAQSIDKPVHASKAVKKPRPKKPKPLHTHKHKPKPRKDIAIKKDPSPIVAKKPEEIEKSVKKIEEKEPEKPQVQPEEKAEDAPKVTPEKDNINKQSDKALSQSNDAQTIKVLKASDGVQDAFFQAIRDAIAKKHKYPAMAERRGYTGTVIVKFLIDMGPKVSDITIVSSSGHDVLDNAAIKTIKKAAKSFPTPKEKAYIEIPITYSLI